MAVIEDTRNRVRWTYARARYVARTEGVGALARTTAAKFGLVHDERPTAQSPRQPLPGRTSGRQWPFSVLVLGSRTLAEPALRDLGVTVFWSTADGPDRQQLVSVLHVAGAANWPPGNVLAEARRLGQLMVLELNPDDPADALPHCDLILVPVQRDDLPTTTPVHLIPSDSQALARLLQEVAA